MYMGDMKFTTAGDFLAAQETLKLQFPDDNAVESFGQETFNADDEYTPLVEGIREILPSFAKIWREEKLPAATVFMDNDIVEEMNNVPVSQRSAELSKQFNIPINNLFGRLLKEQGVNMNVDLNDGYDWVYYGTPQQHKKSRATEIEDKICMSQRDNCREWTGNSNAGQKVPMHLLKRFQLNDKFEIIGSHISLVNLDHTTQYWKSQGGARSSLSFNNEDVGGIISVTGYWHMPKRGKNLFPRFETI